MCDIFVVLDSFGDWSTIKERTANNNFNLIYNSKKKIKTISIFSNSSKHMNSKLFFISILESGMEDPSWREEGGPQTRSALVKTEVVELWLSIYIYICVCVCVCVCIFLKN